MTIQRQVLGSIKKEVLPSLRRVRNVVRTVLSSERVRHIGDINIVFMDNQGIRKLNHDFLNETGTTDVIAFPTAPDPSQKKSLFSGDICISVSVAKDNAKRFQQTLNQELTRLMVHGLLHLLGYDDHSKPQKTKMWKKQEKLVNQLCSRQKS